MERKLALVIGVTQYGKGMSELPAAENDVKTMQQVLEIDGYEVTPIINPNLEEMQTAIQTLFAKERNKTDFLLLFFSGHGITDDSGNFFLTTKNTPKQNFQPKAVPATSVQYFMSNCPARQQVVILNCCYSGAFAQNLQPKSKSYHNWAILASSSPIEISLTDDELSIYTRYLIEGIQTGAADSNKDGIILAHELHDYVKEKVQKVTDNKMTPHFHPVGEVHKIQLVKVPPTYDRTWQCVHTLTDHAQKVNCIAINPDDRTFVSASADKTIKIWNFRTGELINTLSVHSDAVNSIAISPDGKTLVSGSSDQTIKIWNWNAPQTIRTLIGSLFNKIWNWNDPKSIRTLGGNLFYENLDLDVVNSVAITPDGKTLLAGGKNHKVKQWSLENGKELNNLSEQNLGVYSIAVTPDGKKFASDSQDVKIKLFNLETKELVQTFSGHSDWIWSIAISPNGKMLASGSGDKTINVWDLETGKLLYTFNDHSQPVRSVNFSFDSQTVISGSHDNTIKLWNVNSGELILTLTGHSGGVNSVAFSRDGRSIVSGSDDGTIKIWK